MVLTYAISPEVRGGEFFLCAGVPCSAALRWIKGDAGCRASAMTGRRGKRAADRSPQPLERPPRPRGCAAALGPKTTGDLRLDDDKNRTYDARNVAPRGLDAKRRPCRPFNALQRTVEGGNLAFDAAII